MEILRNSIKVLGLSPEDSLPNKVDGEIIKDSRVETLMIPSNKPEAKKLLEVSIELHSGSNRMINSPTGKMIVLDGLLSIKISYIENSQESTTCNTIIKKPYNAFIDLGNKFKGKEIVKIYIVDGYFHLVNPREVYGHFVHLTHIHPEEYSAFRGIVTINSDLQSPELLYDIEEEIL